MTIEDIKELRGHYEEITNDPIAKICDFLIDSFDPVIVIAPESESDEET
jgi:hypothetical protein